VRAGRAQEAVALLEARVDADPADAAAYAALAQAYMAAGDRESAADCLTLALHHDPDNLDALWSLCEVNEALGRVQGAIEPLERIVALRGGVRARGSLARLYFRARRHEEAERTAAALVAEHPDTAEGLDVLGLARIAMEDYEGAIAPLERWVKLRPADLIAPHSLASAYIHRARFDEAGALLSRGISRTSNWPTAASRAAGATTIAGATWASASRSPATSRVGAASRWPARHCSFLANKGWAIRSCSLPACPMCSRWARASS
jgi:tetratricopeptide (TPR) repeat protein